MLIDAKAFASRFDVSVADARVALEALHGQPSHGSTRWDLTEVDIRSALEQVANRPQRPFAELSTPDLLSQYAQTLAELRARGAVRTSNAPLGDYAEHIALNVYGGRLARNSAKSYDLEAADGRTIQVKARSTGVTASSSAVFSVFRSFDFTVATLLVLDSRTYALKWAREMTPEQVGDLSRWSNHVRGYLLPVRVAEKSGIDVTDLFTDYT